MAEKVVLVTGGARRVGAAIVHALHAAGTSVAIHCHHSRGEAQALAAGLEQIRPGTTLVVCADLQKIDQLPELVQSVVARFGRLDVLVNNASTFFPTPVGQITGDSWANLVGTNLKAPLFLSQAAAPELARHAGCIVNIVDIHADRPLKNYVVYSIAKAGLAAMTRSLSRELGPQVRVNGVAPGAVAWPVSGNDFPLDEQQTIVRHTSLKRIGAPEDVAAAVRRSVNL